MKRLEADSVVFSFKLSIGKRAVLKEAAYTNEAICGLLPKDNGTINPRFVYHMLGQMDLEGAVDQAVKGKTLNKAKIAELILQYPHIDEQDQIVDALETADRYEANLRERLKAFRTEKSALMQQLLTGKLRVKFEEVVA